MQDQNNQQETPNNPLPELFRSDGPPPHIEPIVSPPPSQKKKLLIIGLIVVLLAAAGGVFGYWRAGPGKSTGAQSSKAAKKSTASSTEIPSDFMLKRTSSGGLSGTGDGYEFIITADGNLTQSETHAQKPAKTINLTKAQMEMLVSKIKTANFFDLYNRYPLEPRCCDFVAITISITMNDQARSVTYDDLTDETPIELKNLDTFLQSINQ